MSAELQKFKDGVQDTVVFLRMLEQFKIPAVMETRRKKLLEKLLRLQSDRSSKDVSSLEESMSADAEVEGATESKKPMKRVGSIVENKVKAYSKIDFEAKREQEKLNRKSAADGSGGEGAVSPAFVSPSHGSSQGSQQRLASVVSETENVVEEETDEKESFEEVDGAKDTKEDEEEEKEKEEGEKEKEEREIKKKVKLHVGAGLKKMKARFGRSKKGPTSLEEGNYEQVSRNTEAAGADREEEDGAVAAEGMVNGEGGSDPEGEKEEAVIEEELEEGVKMRSNLEKRVAKRFGGFSWVSMSGKLKDSSLIFTVDKKEKILDLSGCTVAKAEDSATGLEVFSHLDQKQWVLRVESEALRDRWVKELQEVINQCAVQQPLESEPIASTTAEEENQVDGIPSIKVEPAEGLNNAPAKKKRPFSSSPKLSKKAKPVSEIPEQGIQKKGYVYRKKGAFGAWEKTYCVVTFAAMYFTSGEEVKEYSYMFVLGVDGSPSVKQEKRGHDKQSQSVVVKYGRNKEIISVPSSDVASWKETLESVVGLGSCELPSEEEEEEEEEETASAVVEPIQDQLYEELPGDEADMIEEDIYEAFDEVVRVDSDSETSIPSRHETMSSLPALPPRNEMKRPSEPALPSLPPRNSLPPSPKLPHRPPQPGKEPPPSTKEPAEVKVAEEEEELYEDIVPKEPAEVKVAEEEELYEDIAPQVASRNKQEDLGEEYTEMTLGDEGPTEEYVLMERGDEEEQEQEMYCEVDPELPSHAVRKGAIVTNSPKLPPKDNHSLHTTQKGAAFSNSLSLPPKGTQPNSKGAKIQKPPPPASHVAKKGKLKYKAPKKSSPYEQWCKMEGPNLCTYKSETSKTASEKIRLNEHDLLFGPNSDGQFAFSLTKGDAIHYFAVGSKDELGGWLSVLRGVTKSAALQLPPGELEVYVAAEDHTAENAEQLSFTSGAFIRVIAQESSDWWVGQLGSSSDQFTGRIGKFPVSKVMVAEDLYI